MLPKQNNVFLYVIITKFQSVCWNKPKIVLSSQILLLMFFISVDWRYPVKDWCCQMFFWIRVGFLGVAVLELETFRAGWTGNEILVWMVMRPGAVRLKWFSSSSHLYGWAKSSSSSGHLNQCIEEINWFIESSLLSCSSHSSQFYLKQRSRSNSSYGLS